MYNPDSQKYPISQFKNNNLFTFIANQLNQYTLPFKNASQANKLDQKQRLLQLKIMEALVSDDKLAANYCWNWQKPRAENIQNNNQDQQGNPSERENLKSNKSKMVPKQQLGNFNLKSIKNEKLKSFLKQFKDQSQLTNQYGLEGKIGLLKFQSVMETIVQHCDSLNETKSIHKVMYLFFKYFQLRLKNNIKKQPSRQNGKAKSIYSVIDDIFQWLRDASNLFSQQLIHPPLTGELPSRRQQHPNRKIYQVASRQKQLLQSIQNQANQLEQGSLKLSNYEIQKENKYCYLLKSVQNYELENLLQDLEQLMIQVSRQYESNQSLSDRQMKNELIMRTKSIISLVLRRLNVEKYKIKAASTNTGLQSRSHIYESSHSIHLITDKLTKALQNSQRSLSKQQNYEDFKKLTLVLKYISSIMLGNRTVISRYCGNNIYKYLMLYIRYIQPNQSESYLSTEKEQFQIQTIKQVVQKYLEQLHSVQISKQSEVSLDQVHSYLLSLISKKLSHQAFPSPPAYLQTHKIIQKSFLIFQGCQFYANLVASILFHIGLVEKQIYNLDEEYENNIIRGLLVDSTIQPKNQILANRPVVSIGNSDDSMEYRFEDEDIRYRSNPFNSSQNGEISSIPIKISPSQSKNLSIKKAASSFVSQKLLLSTISFYKNILYQPSILKKHRLLYPRNQVSVQQFVEQNYYDIPSLNQLIQNLIPTKMDYKNISTSQDLEHLHNLSKYACRIGVEEYFMEWLRHVIKTSVLESGVSFEQQQKLQASQLIDKSKQNISNKRIPGHQAHKLRQFRKVDSHVIQLMIMQLKLALSPSLQIFQWSQFRQNPQYSTLSFNLLFYSQYLTLATLNQPFDYSILAKVEQLAGVGSQLFKINQNAAEQFYDSFQIFFALDGIRSKDVGLNAATKHISKNIPIPKPQKTKIVQKLKQLLNRVEVMTSILSTNNMQGCGQILRTAWQIMTDYEQTKSQTLKLGLQAVEMENLLQKIADKLVILVLQLKHYVEQMTMQGLWNEDLSRLKQMLF